ncbi:MAG: FtsK/SpoIIIE domain-containing protein, partial [Phycisphaerae bacterium]
LLPRIEAQRELGLRETKEWHERSLAELEQGRDRELEAARRHRESQLNRIQHRYEEGCRALEHRWNEGLARIQKPVEEGSRADVGVSYGWDDPVWQTWVPPSQFASVIRFGELRVDLRQITDRVPRRLALPETFTVPALLAFPRQASLLIHTDHAGRAEALRTVQAVMVRLLTSLPAGRVRFTIIDPVGLGQNFAGFMHLADHDEALVGSRIWTEPEHIEQRLADLTEHMETVIQKYLRNEFQTIDDYNAQAGELAEPYRYLVIADFPANLTDVAIHRLNSIAGTGARCGVYTLIVHDTRRSLPAGTHVDDLEAHSINLAREGDRFVWQDDVFRAFPLTLETPPGEEFLTRILHVVGRYAKESRRVEVPFESIAPPDARMWSADSSLDIEVPIGRMGATRLQMLRLGRGVMQHALIAGKTGSGKSTLLHVLVTNLALWYGPDEVEFYLVDFKKGVEFKTYATNALPHARAVAVESDREFGLSVLQRVDAELTRRGNLFRRQGVQDLASYRQASGEKLPRTLLIIDEFQEFFSEDDRLAQDAGLLLDRLVRQGRAFGIHVLLGSQTIGGTSGLARSTIGQMAVRIALQTSEADSQIILGDGNSAARLLSRPGEAIYNDAGGLVEGNSPFQVAWLPDEQRDAYLARIRARYAADSAHPPAVPSATIAAARPPAVVFEGNVPADITKNALLAELLDAPDWPPAAAATRAWIGEPVAIREPTHIVFRRQSGANMLLVGQQDDAALAIMAAVMVSFAAQHRPDAASFRVFDGSPADSPLAAVFARVRAALPHPTRLVEYRAVGEAMSELAAELKRRQESPDTQPPTICVLVYGLQRYRLLRRQEDTFSFSAGAEDAGPGPDRVFADLLREGPPLGIHVIAWADTLATVERTLDRGSVREFDNRILFQMSASDSSNLIDSPLANKLGPNRALAYSEEQGTTEKFRPYALPNDAWLERVKTHLARPTP